VTVGSGPVGGEGPRHQARERALGLLYEADMKQLPPEEILEALAVRPDRYAATLVLGVARHQPRIDRLLTDSSVGWELDRMPALDRAVLRMATYELLEEPDVPLSVVIDEAVVLATEYSTEDSSRFVNGVLSTVAGRVRG
jgi:transcription antitermination protein NusB